MCRAQPVSIMMASSVNLVLPIALNVSQKVFVLAVFRAFRWRRSPMQESTLLSVRKFVEMVGDFNLTVMMGIPKMEMDAHLVVKWKKGIHAKVGPVSKPAIVLILHLPEPLLL